MIPEVCPRGIFIRRVKLLLSSVITAFFPYGFLFGY